VFAWRHRVSLEQIPVLTAQSWSRKFRDVGAHLASRLARDVLLMIDGLSISWKMSATHDMAYIGSVFRFSGVIVMKMSRVQFLPGLSLPEFHRVNTVQ
jgi:hypothetical protein